MAHITVQRRKKNVKEEKPNGLSGTLMSFEGIKN
jgi:hypothetical protein